VVFRCVRSSKLFSTKALNTTGKFAQAKQRTMMLAPTRYATLTLRVNQ
jgi:hypothetical protein